jgi:hypothetical protein
MLRDYGVADESDSRGRCEVVLRGNMGHISYATRQADEGLILTSAV